MATHWAVGKACRIIENGGVIAYPTETVYGLGADPLDLDAVRRILDIKNRAWEKGLILLASNIEQLLPYIIPVDEIKMRDIQATWPGPFTWVFEASPLVPAWVRGKHTSIAVRVTPHPWAHALCERFGRPIISTSANPSGFAATQNRVLIEKWFHGHIDYVLPGDPGPYTKPSEIRDARSGKVLRG